ncbi:hypothetical protein [Kordiimonas laminariae]|uniref:hypothetical protein n=1 Tax=Kordiimonas laminariae TaxID=2917717 RepID=UPI001FF3B8FB|nr:hypothetical protein [Kordiimonas laminariae]MCK0069951.1 hypothetical protein [Kordiimonas laminariae]
MSDQAQERFEALKVYFDKLPAKEKEREAAKGQTHDGAVFDLIKNGDGVGLYASVQKDPSLLEKQDEKGMTPLHWSAADKSGLTYEITTSQPSNAPWMRDNFDRLPMEVAKEAGREQDQLKLERVTYPQLFQQEKNGPEQSAKVSKYYKKHKETGKADTRARENRALEKLKAKLNKLSQTKELGSPKEKTKSKSRGR